MVERLLKFELSLTKINSSLVECLALEDAIQLGLPFWGVDPEQIVSKRRSELSNLQLAASASGRSSAGLSNPPQKLSEKVIEKLV